MIVFDLAQNTVTILTVLDRFQKQRCAEHITDSGPNGGRKFVLGQYGDRGVCNYLEDHTELVNACLKQSEQNSVSGKVTLMPQWTAGGRESSEMSSPVV